MPAVKSGGEGWSLDRVAQAFDSELRARLVPCGILGTSGRAAPLDSGMWRQRQASETAEERGEQ